MIASLVAHFAKWENQYRCLIYREPCVYCGERRRKTRMSREHILPRCFGGTNAWENLAGACRTCNAKRGNMPLLHFLVMMSYTRGHRVTKKQLRAMGFHYGTWRGTCYGSTTFFGSRTDARGLPDGYPIFAAANVPGTANLVSQSV